MTNLEKANVIKKHIEKELSKVSATAVEVTFARKNMITICWDGENKTIFDKLQNFFKGQLFDYEFDEECSLSVCCLNF